MVLLANHQPGVETWKLAATLWQEPSVCCAEKLAPAGNAARCHVFHGVPEWPVLVLATPKMATVLAGSEREATLAVPAPFGMVLVARPAGVVPVARPVVVQLALPLHFCQSKGAPNMSRQATQEHRVAVHGGSHDPLDLPWTGWREWNKVSCDCSQNRTRLSLLSSPAVATVAALHRSRH